MVASFLQLPPLWYPSVLVLPFWFSYTWLTILSVKFFLIKSLRSWLTPETEHREVMTIKLIATQEYNAYTISFNKRKKVRNAPWEEKPKQRPTWQYLWTSITVHSQKMGTHCMSLVTPTWSWGGTILRKVMLDRQSNKYSFHPCFRSNPSTASSLKPAVADILRCSSVP